MSGVFLSYSRGDRDLASAIINGLRAVGVSVWWDEDMHSIDWHQELERQIVELATIVVIWSPNSVNSANVKDEARLGLENSKLINIIVGLPKPPFPFDRVNGLPLDGWVERVPNSGWTRLVETIEEKVVAKGGVAKGDFTAVLARQEDALKLKQHALTRAHEALEEAQAREAETVDAAEVAQNTFARAEEQHVRVMEMHATHLIMSAAAQEYEAARAAKEDADRALRAARAEVKGVSREVALAAAALERPDASAPERRPKGGAPTLSAKGTATESAAPAAASAAEPGKPPSAAETPATASTAAAKPVASTPPPAAPAPAVKPAAAPVAPTPAKASASEPSSGSKSSPLLMITAGAVVVLGLAVAGSMLMGHRTTPAAAPASTPAAAAPAGAAQATAATDPKAAAVKAAQAIAGKWALEGLGCDNPIVIAVKDGAVSMTVGGATSTAAIDSNPAPGVINAVGEKGGSYVYKLGQDKSLSMVDPDHQSTKMSKCAG
jgi:hypothetical protein